MALSGELTALVGVGSAVAAVVAREAIGHFVSVGTLRSTVAVLATEIKNIVVAETACRGELMKAVKCLDEKVGDVRETLARIEGRENGKGSSDE